MRSAYRLLRGDFRDYAADLSGADVVITDPPYGIGFDYGPEASYDDHGGADYIDMLSALRGLPLVIINYPEEAMRSFVPALGVPDEVITWCYPSNLPGRQSRLVCFYNVAPDWTKVRQPYKNPNDARIKKLIAAGSKGARSYDWWADINLVKNVSKTDFPHPCPIPVELARRLVEMTTEPGQTVADPFAGSASVGVAAVESGRKFVGIELDESFAAVADSRLQQLSQRSGATMSTISQVVSPQPRQSVNICPICGSCEDVYGHESCEAYETSGVAS